MKYIGVLMRQELLDGKPRWFYHASLQQLLQRYDATLLPISSLSLMNFALQHCHGFLIPGGYDIAPAYLHTSGSAYDQYYTYPIDHFDFCCLQQIVQAKKPLLCICRGMQVLNVYFHGSLCPHIDTRQHAPTQQHKLQIIKDTPLSFLYPSAFTVNSYHHQCVATCAESLLCFAKSEDGIIEGICHPQQPWIGVQWHPELMPYDPLIPYFFDVLCAVT